MRKAAVGKDERFATRAGTVRDPDVRRALMVSLSASHRHDPDTRIFQEMGVWGGSVRVDLAVVNGEMHGYELKSAQDNLSRLPKQAEIYNQVFDRVTLVLASQHLRHGRDLLPDWWGLIIAEGKSEGDVRLSAARSAELNPSINPLTVARMLWKSECLSVLEKHGIDRGYRSKTLDLVHHHLANSLALDTLRSEVRACLKGREFSRQLIGNN